ncbi:MAG: DUF362 domain-containing protein [Desulfovibrionaceae bacterium]
MNSILSALPFPVALHACADYQPERVDLAIFGCLDACGWAPPYGCRVLVKPNLLRADALTCTHPYIVRAACQWLLDHHAQVTVADSPGFGTAAHVARSIGLSAALKPLGLSVASLEQALPVPLPHGGGGHWGVSATALQADVILSVPKVKAHCQMRLTLAVKNLFGCVCGWRKAVAHTVQGVSAAQFTAALVDLWAALPPVMALADGIEGMHKTGPSGGAPFPLHCVAASTSAMALDTAFYTMLKVQSADVPLWLASCKRQIAGAQWQDLTFPLAQPHDFDTANFIVPAQLMGLSFRPQRLLFSLCRRWWQSVFPHANS